jgi:GTP pyrophosphokinase
MVDFDLRRGSLAALTSIGEGLNGIRQATLRTAEDLVHRVRGAFVDIDARADPVAWMIRTHRTIHRDGDGKALRRAYAVADQMHYGQLRKSGEPYITHPLAVAQILAELGMDTTTLIAALLHDTVEDTSYTLTQLREDFGAEVALLVDGVTKFDRVFYGDVAEVETIRKMIVAAGVDVRVLIVKIADRLHNMRTIEVRSAASRARIARATQEVLIPLCDRLGIQRLKRDLEDSVLAALHPEQHSLLRAWVAHRPEWTTYVDSFIAGAESVLREARIRARVVARPRHLYSLWQDTYGKGRDQPYELPRVEIIVAHGETDCYTALGAVHSSWRPVVGRFKDFIASPKNNLYRSLHTTVIGPQARAVELLIRTEAMQRNAEYGIAAAFRFGRRRPGAHSARGRRSRGLDTADHLEWLRRLVEWQRAAVEPDRFLESLRCDLAEGQVHVFVAGKRLLLPANSTPIDVAYALGTEVGDRCVAATVNGQLVFLSSPLADGDVVEIHTAHADVTKDLDGRPIGPSPEWRSVVRTPNARLQIERRVGARAGTDPELASPLALHARVRIGHAAICLELRRRGRSLASDMPLLALCDELGYPDMDSLLVATADKVIGAGDIAERLIEQVDSGAVEAALTGAAMDPYRRP